MVLQLELTKQESEGTPEQFKYPRHFPQKYDHQEAGYYFCSYNISPFIILVENTKGPVHHQSEKSVHRTYVV